MKRGRRRGPATNHQHRRRAPGPHQVQPGWADPCDNGKWRNALRQAAGYDLHLNMTLGDVEGTVNNYRNWWRNVQRDTSINKTDYFNALCPGRWWCASWPAVKSWLKQRIYPVRKIGDFVWLTLQMQKTLKRETCIILILRNDQDFFHYWNKLICRQLTNPSAQWHFTVSITFSVNVITKMQNSFFSGWFAPLFFQTILGFFR